MTTETFTERQPLGIHRFTGSLRGQVFTNEREVEIEEEGQTIQAWKYDIFEVDNAADPNAAKNEIVKELYPNGDEFMIIRQTLTGLLKGSSKYDLPKYATFKAYNEAVEAIQLEATTV